MLLRIVILISSFLNGQALAHLQNDPVAHFEQGIAVQNKANVLFEQNIKKSAVPLSIKQDKPLLIYFINPTRQISDYWLRNKIAFTHRLDELAIKYVIKSHDIKVKANEDQKRRLLKRILDNNPDYVVLSLDTVPEMAFIKQLLEQSKTRLIVQNMTTPIRNWYKNHPLIYVGFAHETGSEMLAEHFSQSFPENANFAVNNYYPGYISQLRGNNFIERLQKKSNFNMLSHFHTNATEGAARQHTLKLVEQYPQLDFIYASSTDIAIGTSEALEELKREDILVNGWGGGSAELEAIKNGQLDVTVMRMNDDNAVAMAEAIKLVLENKENLVPLVYSGEFKLVTPETSPLDLNEYIKYAFRYSDRKK